jgi:glutathione S-transferase
MAQQATAETENPAHAPHVEIDPAGRSLTATVTLPASAERVFHAIASREITLWWVRPGVFDTQTWEGDVRVGGRWQTSGDFRGEPYTLEGQFAEVRPPTALAHTWTNPARPAPSSTVRYDVEPIASGTRLTLRHGDFPVREATEANAAGWETSLRRLAELLSVS